MKCGECDTENIESAQFCQECGEKLVQSSKISNVSLRSRLGIRPNIMELNKKKDVNGLINALDYKRNSKNISDVNFRVDVIRSLGNIGDNQAVDPLIVTLTDPEYKIRWRSAHALEKIGDKRAVKQLIVTLKDPEYNVRWQAADALGSIGDKQAIEPLKLVLNDPEYKVRSHAAIALKKLGIKINNDNFKEMEKIQETKNISSKEISYTKLGVNVYLSILIGTLLGLIFYFIIYYTGLIRVNYGFVFIIFILFFAGFLTTILNRTPSGKIRSIGFYPGAILMFFTVIIMSSSNAFSVLGYRAIIAVLIGSTALAVLGGILSAIGGFIGSKFY